jgi:hypothetical protein
MAITKKLTPSEYDADRIKALKEIGKYDEVKKMAEAAEQKPEKPVEQKSFESTNRKRSIRDQANEILAELNSEMESKNVDKKVQKRVYTYGLLRLRAELNKGKKARRKKEAKEEK